MTIEEFCNKHGACNDGRKWAMANCVDMQDAWDKLKPEWLIWVAIREGVLTEKELRLFAVFCAREVQHLMTDERSVNAIDIAERHAYGMATDGELAAARDAAWYAGRAAALAAAKDAALAAAKDAAAARAAARAAAAALDAAWAAAWAEAKDAARAAARDAAAALAWEAAWAAALARDAAWDAARDAALEKQTQWLRDNTKPNFGA